MNRQESGQFGEELVARALIRHGCVVVARNVHTRHGELDVVATRNEMIHVIEVKARSSRNFGFEETVTQQKLRKIVLAVHDAQSKGLIPKGSWCIDVAFVWLGDPRKITVSWVWNVGLE